MVQDLFARGVAIGFVVAFALGPIGLLVIRRTLERGWRMGVISGLGVATADATYAAIAAFGLTALTGLLVGIDRPLGVVGGTILLVLAVRALRAALRAPANGRAPDTGARDPRPPGRRGALGAWLTMVGLTLTNPATILSFTALFASIGAGTDGVAGATVLVAGVFIGSTAWWALLTGLIAGLRTRLTPAITRALNVASAAIIGTLGLGAIWLGVAG
jgi:threonine/homoserine/homoserine lactone efflux protein